jgi:hypothetical protein
MAKPTKVQKRIADLSRQNIEVRRSAVKKLGAYGDAAAVESLCRALRDEDPHVRRGAAYALGKLGDVNAFEPLQEALNDMRPGLRHAAAWALGQLGKQKHEIAMRAVFFIVRAAQKSKAQDRYNYVRALTEMGLAAVVPLCLEFNSRRSAVSQECARQALTFLEHQQKLAVVPCLLEASDLTAPQQWTVLEMLSQERPTGLFADRRLANPRRFIEMVAADGQVPDTARRSAHAILEYLSLGRASQRQEATDATQLLRMAQENTAQDTDGGTLLRGSQCEDNAYASDERLLTKLRRWLRW